MHRFERFIFEMNHLLVILLPLFFLAVHEFSVISGRCPCESCITKRQFLERFNLIGKSNQEAECNPLPPTVITATPKRTIDLAFNPRGLIAYGNYVFVSGNDGNVHKYDDEGNFIATFDIPLGNPQFLEIYDNKLYAPNLGKDVYVKSLCDDVDNFESFFTTSFAGLYAIKFTPDGSHFLLTASSNVHVFNSQSLTLVSIITIPSGSTRKVQFDADGNMYVSSASTIIYKYDNNFNFVSTIDYSPDAFHVDGWIFQCDGSKILGDHAGRVIFVDKDDNEVEVQGRFTGIFDVAITKSGALFLSDVNTKKVIIY